MNSESGKGNVYTGSESFFGVFTQAQVYLSGVRLVHDGKVTQQVSDLASQIENNRRRFLHSGDIKLALQDVLRVTSNFNQRVQAWESEASRREQNKKNMSGGALAKMKAEMSMVRTKTRLASRTLNKLEVELHQIAGSESSTLAQSTGSANDRVGSQVVDSASSKDQEPVLSIEEQAKSDQSAREVILSLQQLVGKSLVVAFEKAGLEIPGDPDRVEQAWDAQAEMKLPIFLVAGWTVKHPNNPYGTNLERKQLDLCYWIVPKSLNASNALRYAVGQPRLWISSKQLDSVRITFGLASENELPRSRLVTGFLQKFANKYDKQSPTLLVAHLQNLEWTQKTVVVSCSEARA